MGKFFDELKGFVAGSHKKNLNNGALKTQYAPLTEEQKKVTLSMEQLQAFNWNNFGNALLQGGLLPTSYVSEPEDVDVYVGVDRLPRVQLTFGSEIQKQKQTLVIARTGVMVAVDGQGYVDSPAMSKIWQEMSGLEPELEIGPVM